MLRRVAFLLILLLISGTALFAARHFGVTLPWDIATTDPGPASKDREQASEASPEKTVEETTAALRGAPEDAPPPASGDVSIDISRISPDGTSVFAGRAEPDSYVTVLENGKPAGTVKADGHGEWSLSTEHRFASTDPKLSYEVSRTPPPEPAPAAPEPPKVAAKAPEPAQSAASVASEVMRKFENLVEEAREEAKKSEAAKSAPAEEAKSAPAEEQAAEKPVAEQKEPEAEAPQDKVAAAAPEPETRTPSESAAGTAPPAPAAEPERPAEANVAATPTAPQESRSTTPSVIPLPITFVYNEAVLTPDGRRAAQLLLEYLTLKKLATVELTGHADERGSDAYNFDLSRERLETVSQLLREGGYTGDLKLIPKGKTEPYMGVDRKAYRGEALYQLDRRVELRLGR